MSTNDRVSGPSLPLFQATTSRLGGMSVDVYRHGVVT